MDSKKIIKIALLGGGVAGLSAAMRLKKSNLDSISEIVILEKQFHPGGLLQSTSRDGYWWDNGVFKFSSSSFLPKLLPDLFQPVKDYSRKIWYREKFYEYPLALNDLILSQSASNLIMASLDYVPSRVRCSLKLGISNLHDWLRYRMTARLLKQSHLETYISKLQGRATNELSLLLGESRLDYIHNITRPVRLFKKVFASLRKQSKKGNISPLLLCKQSVGTISQRLAELCESSGIKIYYGANIREIACKSKNGFEICYDSETKPHIYHASHLISTIPLDEFVQICRFKVTDECLFSAKRLAFMDMKLFFFIINRPAILHQYMVIYSFEKHHKWKRLVARSLPCGLSSILVEMTFDPMKGEPGQDNIDIVARELANELKLFNLDEISVKHSTIVRKAYPVYEIGFEKRVATIIKELESEKLRIAGRQGRFFYANTSKVIQSASDAADKILQSISIAINN